MTAKNFSSSANFSPLNWSLALASLACVALCASGALAGNEDSGSFGTRGGGFTMPGDSGRRLVDLGDGRSCVFYDGEGVGAALPDWDRFVETIAGVNPYFAEALLREARALSVCFTEVELAPLEAGSVFDPGRALAIAQSLVTPSAVRVFAEDRVYIYLPDFRDLPPRDQTLLWIHEVLHGFFDHAREGWYQNLKNTVQAISKLEGGSISALDFERQLAVNHVLVPGGSRALNRRERELVSAAFEVSGVDRIALQSAASKIKPGTLSVLYPRDQAAIRAAQRAWVSEAYESAELCDAQDLVARLERGLSPNALNPDFAGTPREKESLLVAAVKGECLEAVETLLLTPKIHPAQGRDSQGKNARQLAWESRQREAFRAIFKRSFRKWDW